MLFLHRVRAMVRDRLKVADMVHPCSGSGSA